LSSFSGLRCSHRPCCSAKGLLRHLRAEKDHVLPGERARGHRAAVHHHRLAGGRQHRVDDHDQEDGVKPVVADDARDGIGDRAEQREERHGAGI
jgi:hypothetical protein